MKILKIDQNNAKKLWISAQTLNNSKAFSNKNRTGSEKVADAISHLGYVQIDTINVIERCHHHILYNRIPGYKREHLNKAQAVDKSIFEYWTHALAYIPTADYAYYIKRMQRVLENPGYWMGRVTEEDYKKVLKILRKGPVSIRDINDDELREKEHTWDSQKPSKRALQYGFYKGEIVICRREGMLKYYDLANRHFNRKKMPAAADESEIADYMINRALRSQAIISVDSICHLQNKSKPFVVKSIEERLENKKLIELKISEAEKTRFFTTPEFLEQKIKTASATHILSPFDPLIIQRKRLKQFFNFEYIFEAYVPAKKRKFGYFSLPVLHENNIVALLDLKADRQNNELIINNWHWTEKKSAPSVKNAIENELHRFEKFQLSKN